MMEEVKLSFRDVFHDIGDSRVAAAHVRSNIHLLSAINIMIYKKKTWALRW
jgi:hypothetical protein